MRVKSLSIIGRLSIGIIICYASSGLCAQTVTYQEANGVVVVEVESATIVTPWTQESSGGITYFRGGEDHFNSPGIGVLSYQFTVQNSGRYQVNWRSSIGNGSENTEHNDSFARLTDCAGSPLAPVSNSNTVTGSEQWYKLYMNRLSWDYETSNRDNDPKSLSWNLTAGQSYVFQISTRSKDHLLDRIVLWNHAMHDYANKVTGKTYSSTSSDLDALEASETGGVVDPPPHLKIQSRFYSSVAGWGRPVFFPGHRKTWPAILRIFRLHPATMDGGRLLRSWRPMDLIRIK